MQSIIDATRNAIERGQAAGVMRDVPPADTAAVLTWMVERAGYQLIRGTEPTHDQEHRPRPHRHHLDNALHAVTALREHGN